MGRGTSRRSGTSQGTLLMVRDVSGDPQGVPGRVGGPSGRSEDPFGVPGWIGGPSERFGTGRETFGEVRDG